MHLNALCNYVMHFVIMIYTKNYVGPASQCRKFMTFVEIENVFQYNANLQQVQCDYYRYTTLYRFFCGGIDISHSYA